MFWKVRNNFLQKKTLQYFIYIFYRKLGHAALTLRSRLRCIIVRRPGSEDKEYKLPNIISGQDNYCNSTPKPTTNILVSIHDSFSQ